MSAYTVYYGTLIHSVSISQMDIVQNGVLIVDPQGVIVHVEKDVANLQEFLDSQSYKDVEVSPWFFKFAPSYSADFRFTSWVLSSFLYLDLSIHMR